MLKRLSATFNGINNEQQQQLQQPGLSIGPPYHHPGIAGAANNVHPAALNAEQLYAGSYPRPAALSTPTALSDGGRSSSSSYFNRPYSNSAAGSRNTSPLPSPNASVSRAYNPYANAAVEAPAAGIERLTLQKSLKALETLLVALDEYRELHTRITKVEKKLGKNVKDLAATMQTPNEGGKPAQSTSIVQALNASGTFFETLSEVSSKHSRLVSKEYESINEVASKFFRKIAKEEKAHDDALESLDAKLKKANYNYDKKVRSTMPGPSSGYNSKQSMQAGFGSASAAHEQFVPLLNSLAEEMARTKVAHATSMAKRREECIASVARTMTDLSDAEFRKTCEDVRKSGKLIGGILALNAMLGFGEKSGNATMPRDWPPELPNNSDDETQPLASLTTSPHRVQPQLAPHQRQQAAFPSNSRRSSDAFSQSSSSPRQQDNRQMPNFVSPNSSFQSSSSASQQRQDQGRAVSFGSVRSDVGRHEDIDATVTARTSQAKPSFDTSFYQQQPRQPPSTMPLHQPQQQQERYQEGSPSLRNSTSARQPLVRTPLHHSLSHSAKVSSYFPNPASSTTAEEHEDRSDSRQGVTMPTGFVMEETDLSPIKSKSIYRPNQDETGSQTSPTTTSDRRTNSGDSLDDQSPVRALEAAANDITSGPLQRSVSIESTASEQSFVQRMKAKYAQEKEARINMGNTTSRPPSSAAPSAPGSKVTSMAQKYESRPSAPTYPTDPIYSSPPSNQPAVRPSHAHRVSLPVLPSSSYNGITSSRFTGPAAPRSPLPDERLNRSAENMNQSQDSRQSRSRHPSICGCEDCSATGYTSPALRHQQQRVFSENLMSGSGQDTIKSTRSDRRVSMPMPAGSGRY